MSQFHHKHGRSIDIGEDGRTAWKNGKIGSNWLYSKRDVQEDEIVCIRVSELSKKPGKKPLIVSVTDQDPLEMPVRPKASDHLCGRALPLPISEITEGTMIILMYNVEDRLLYLGIDGILRGVTSLWGLKTAERWLAVRIDGNVRTIQIQESPENQWNSFVLETTRVAKVFKNLRFFNCGATGLQQSLLSFHAPFERDMRVQLSHQNRTAVVQGGSMEQVTLFTARPVLLNEVVSISLTRVCYGTSVEVFATPQNPESYDHSVNPNFSLKVDVSHDSLLRLICTEKGVLIQGIGNYVQSSTRFHPFGPVWLVFRVSTPASFLNMEFEDPHHLPASSSLRDNRMVVRNRAYSKRDDENTLMCKICFQVKMDTVISPCYHLSMCAECTRKVMERTHWRCPVCTEVVDGFFKVHVI